MNRLKYQNRLINKERDSITGMRAFTIIMAVHLFCGVAKGEELAEITDHRTTYMIKSQRDVEIRESYTMILKSEKAHHFSLFIDYQDKFKSLKDISIVIRDIQGRKVKRLTKADARIIGGDAIYEMTDNKYILIDPGYQQYPFIMEVTKTTVLNGFIDLPVWVPQKSFNVSVANSTLEVIYSSDVMVRIREENINVSSDSLMTDGTMKKKYLISSLPHVDMNMRYKDFYKAQPKVYITPYKFELDKVKGSNASWADFGNWFLELNSDPYALTDETTQYLDALDKTDTRQTVQDIFGYMQQRTRYVSIQLGIGGFKSMPTEQVDAKGYGDCKALTTYTKNMLAYSGIKSNYILVRAGEDVPDVIEEFPSSQFNHVFLAVPLPEDTIYLECTSQIIPPDYIGTFTDDRNVLWIEKDKSTIIRSPRYSHGANRQKNIAKIYLDETGVGDIHLQSQRHGIFFDDFMLYSSAPEDFVSEYNLKEFSYKDFVIKSFSFEQAVKNAPVLHVNFRINVSGLAKVAGQRLIMPFNVLKPAMDYIDYNEFMKYADISRGLTIKDSVEVEYNETYWIDKVPEPVSFSNKYGSYKFSIRPGAGKVIIERALTFYKGKYIRDVEFENFKEFINTIRKHEMRNIILYSKT